MSKYPSKSKTQFKSKNINQVKKKIKSKRKAKIQSIRPIPVRKFRKFLKAVGCEIIRKNGGHEDWGKKGLSRPIVVQTHKKEVPQFHIKGDLRTLGMSNQEYFEIISNL